MVDLLGFKTENGKLDEEDIPWLVPSLKHDDGMSGQQKKPWFGVRVTDPYPTFNTSFGKNPKLYPFLRTPVPRDDQ